MPNKIEFKAPCGVPTVHAVRGYRAKWQCGMISMDFKHPGNAPTVRAVRGAVRARYLTVAAENPSILGLLAYVQCAELPCRAASASWSAKVAKTATSQ